jgi:APA family basic amino acid/polyamine antiporter
MPRALWLGLSIVTAIYIAVSVAFLYLVGPDQLGSDRGDAAFAALAGRALFGRGGELAFAAVVVISAAGSLAAVLMAFPRVYYAMARDGLFFSSFAAVGPGRGTPARAIALQATLAAVLALSGSFDQILGYFMVPTLVFLALAVAAGFVLRRRAAAGGEPGLAIPGYPITPLVCLVPVLIVIVLQTARDPLRAGIGLAVVAAGLPISGLVVSSRRAGEPAPLPVSSSHPVSEP